MFKYFPTNYVWNLSVDLAIEMGARIGEIEEMCAPLQEAARAADAAGTQAFRETWVRMADKLCALADEDISRGRLLSAGEKLNRAAIYLITAERLQAHGAEGRIALYRRELDLFAKGVTLSHEACLRVEIPYEREHLAALYVRAHGVQGRAPILVQVNGLDSTKEMRYRVGLPDWLARRGVSSLVVDQPGTGEALRLHGMTARYDSEHWASRIFDWLERRDDVDPARIGLEGVSLGGYFCPRAVAFEPRFACGVAWGANHDWREVQKTRRVREGNFPVPHYWAHVCWVWGASGRRRVHEDCRRRASRWRRRAHQGAVPGYARREGFADSAANGRSAPTTSSSTVRSVSSKCSPSVKAACSIRASTTASTRVTTSPTG